MTTNEPGLFSTGAGGTMFDALKIDQQRELKNLELKHRKQRAELLGEDHPEAAVSYQEINQIQKSTNGQLAASSSVDQNAAVDLAKLDFNIVRNGLHYAEHNGEFYCREVIEIQQKFDRDNQADIDRNIALTVETMKKRVKDRYADSPAKIDVACKVIDQVAEATKNLKPLNRVLTLLDDDVYYYNPELIKAEAKIWGWNDFRNEFFNNELIKYIPKQLIVAAGDYSDVAFASKGANYAIMFADQKHGGQQHRNLITNSQTFKIEGAFGYMYMDINPENGKPFLRFRYDNYGQRGFFDGERVMSLPQFLTCAPAVDFASRDYKVNTTDASIVNGYLYPQIDEKIKIDPEKKTAPLHFLDEMMGAVDPDADRNTRKGDVMLDFFQTSKQSMSKMKINSDHSIEIEGKTYSPVGYFKPSEKNLCGCGYVHLAQSKLQKL